MSRYFAALLLAEALTEVLHQMEAKDDYYSAWHMEDAEAMLTHDFADIVPNEGRDVFPKFRMSIMRRFIRASENINMRDWKTASGLLAKIAYDIAAAFRMLRDDDAKPYENAFLAIADLAQDMTELFWNQEDRYPEEGLVGLRKIIERGKQRAIDAINELDPDREVPFTPTVRLPR